MRRRPVCVLATFLVVGLLFVARQRGEAEEESTVSNAARNHVAGESSPARANRLAGQASPYLLQHAGNPVDWYPWGGEAIGRARRENKPIFLSIGYSACHWCHVMERESFEDPKIAKILNDHFISIKVDREERPDVDEIYMTAVQMMTGQGGWPLSVFLTPELKPFFGGTYFPPEERFGIPSFSRVLLAVAQAWRDRRDDLDDNADRVLAALREHASPAAPGNGPLDGAIFPRAATALRREFDPEWGGFGGAPKFPPSAAIAFLLREQRQTGQRDLLEMATVTLDRMAAGGMHDQIGGGFHRYSVDAQWLVPHFEKMLYDNAILAKVYVEAWQATGDQKYRRVAEGIFEYVLRDMTHSEGGFHSAEDADSEGVEGRFYVWNRREILAALGKEDGQLFCDFYGVSEGGNFEGKSILHVAHDPAKFASGRGLSPQELQERLAPLRRRLLEVRNGRVRPGKDDKVLAAWNGMMISALARGYQVFGNPRYREAAERAADFVLAEMVRNGTLLRTYRGPHEGEGRSKLPAYLDDYAEMAFALADLYEATFDLRRLEAADRLVRKMVADFWDSEHGGFFYTSGDHRDLLVRMKPAYDGAVPSGNSVAAAVLLRLAKLLDEREYLGKAERVLASMQPQIATQPRGHLNLICAADFCLRPGREIALVARPQGSDTERLLRVIHGKFIPNKVLALLDPGSPDAEAVGRRIPLLAGKTMIDGKATAYVCENFACKQPVDDAAALEAALEEVLR